MHTNTDQLRAWLIGRARARGLSHAQLALRSGVDRSTVTRILRGDRSPTFETAACLIQALNFEAMPTAVADVAAAMGPQCRVERALREDPEMTDAQVADVMRYYGYLRGGTTKP